MGSHIKSTQWGIAASMGRALPSHVLSNLIDQMMSETTPAEVIARFVVLAEIHDRDSLRPDVRNKLVDACKKIREVNRGEADRWPRFVARSLQEVELNEVLRFMKQIIPIAIIPGNDKVFNMGRPLELDYVDKERRISEQYRLKVNPRGLYLKELLGEKTAETLIADKTTTPVRSTMPTPGAGTSRRLSRHRSTAASSASAFNTSANLIPLGRSRMNGISKKPITPASAKFSTIKKKHERVKTFYMDDDQAKKLLPPPSDTLRARQQRQEERLKKKEEEQRRKEVRAEEARKRESERKRRMREKKQEATRRYRNHRRYETHSGEEVDEIEDLDQVEEVEKENSPSNDPLPIIDLVDSDDGETGSHNQVDNVVRTSSRTSIENNTPAPKRVRVVPRRSEASRPRTGEEAFAARARISGANSRINELERSLRRPEYANTADGSRQPPGTPSRSTRYGGHIASPMRPPPVFEPNGRSTAATKISTTPFEVEFANVEFPQSFKDAVGEHVRNLSNQQIREILKFIVEDNATIAAMFRGEEERKEYVLKEYDDYSLVLRLLKNGTWQRVRFSGV